MSIRYHRGIDILYQDEALLVVNKPANLLTVPGRGEDKQDCLIHRIQEVFANARIIHRLDMATSGVIIIALSHETQAALSQQFALREVHKTYIAVVNGKLKEAYGTIDLPLLCDWDNRPKQKVDKHSGKPAQTHYKMVDYDAEDNASRVELTPVTGRSHQLRVHMQALGHPIIGDYFYAPKELQLKSERLLLHSCEIGFKHPVSGERLIIRSAAPF